MPKSFLKNATALVSLDLSESSFSEDYIRLITNQHKTLMTLILGGSLTKTKPDDKLDLIGNLLQGLPNLTELDLGKNHINANIAALIPTYLVDLQRLILVDNHIGNKGFEAILQDCKKLIYLDVGQNQLSLTNYKAASIHLPDTLVYLDLSDNPINEDRLKAIDIASSSLRELLVKGRGYMEHSKEGITHLKALPNVIDGQLRLILEQD